MVFSQEAQSPTYCLQHHFLALHRNDSSKVHGHKLSILLTASWEGFKAASVIVIFTCVLIHTHTHVYSHSLTHSLELTCTHTHVHMAVEEEWTGGGSLILSSTPGRFSSLSVHQCVQTGVCVGRAELCGPGSCCCWLQSAQHCGCLKNYTTEHLLLLFPARCFSETGSNSPDPRALNRVFSFHSAWPL